ncbi:MAG: hypothetical protein DRO09_04240 [Thermoprotei archaeon]|nr:MAG: hypothetical protein DRO09_04240 [Thermoprotei archaeon]
MPKWKKYEGKKIKKSITIPEELHKRILKYRVLCYKREKRIPNYSEAVAELVELGLKCAMPEELYGK